MYIDRGELGLHYVHCYNIYVYVYYCEKYNNIYNIVYLRVPSWMYSDGARRKFVKTNMVHLFIEIRPTASSPKSEPLKKSIRVKREWNMLFLLYYYNIPIYVYISITYGLLHRVQFIIPKKNQKCQSLSRDENKSREQPVTVLNLYVQYSTLVPI